MDVCSNCDTHLSGKYCHACGQKVIEPKERRLSHFIYQFFGSAFFLENNFLKNLWCLLAKPGLLPKDYLVGKRKRHMTPISLFFLINLIYFFVSPLTDLNLSLSDQLNQPHHQSFAPAMLENRLEERQISFDEYQEYYADQSTSLSKSLIILHIPIMALLLMGLYWKGKLFFTDHLVFSLYLMGYVLLLSIITSGALKLINLMPWLENRLIVAGVALVLLGSIPIYFFVAIRRFYEEKVLWTLIKTPLVIVIFIFSHFVYRTLLFLVVFWTT